MTNFQKKIIGAIFYKRPAKRGNLLVSYMAEHEKYYECLYATGATYLIEKDDVIWVGESEEQFKDEHPEYFV